MREVEPCSDSHMPRMEGSAGTGGASVGEGIHQGWRQRKKNLVTGVKAYGQMRVHIPGRWTSPYKDGDTEAEVISVES